MNRPAHPDRKPDLNGIWQVLGTAHWNLEAHSASEVCPRASVSSRAGRFPYQPWALAKRNENLQNRLMADPLRKCYMPGVPRATYLPFPFEVTQTPNHILIAYEFAPRHPHRSSWTARRTSRIWTSGWATRAESGRATRWSSTR